MTATAPLFATLITATALLVMAAVIWWGRAGCVHGDDADAHPGDDLHCLFDELTRAAEADGVFDADIAMDPRMADAADITPAPMYEFAPLAGPGMPARALPMPVMTHL